MKKGLVFCGGGAKGSYECGVWKYLNEKNMKFDIVTGTSIGALNAAMYAQHDYERCMELWNKIRYDMILKNGFSYDERINIKVSLKQREDLLSFLTGYLKTKGGDPTPFLKLMDEYIDPERLVNSDVTLGIVTALFPSFKGVEVNVKELKPDEVKQYLLASVSAFPVFKTCKIGNNLYVDGGYYDNLPINFALHLGAMDIVAVDLNPNITHKEYLNKPYIKYIHPTWPLGGFLKFDNEIIMNNFNLGYNDARKAFGELIGFKYLFNKIEEDAIFTRKFVIRISNLVAYMQKNKIKTNVKPEIEGNIFHILEKSTYRPLSDFDYYIRGVEVVCEFLNIDHYIVYNLNEILTIIDSMIASIDYVDVFNGYSRLKNPGRQRDFISKIDDKSLLRYLYEKILNEEELSVELLANILASKPIIFISYCVLLRK
ncbi:MAG: patatin-like phospholipase family protein [Anaeroplasmataceae bacterium]